jgi:hypothetical protein
VRPPEARPRTAAQIAALAPCPEVVAEARRRGVEEIVHFSTVKGTVGILSSRAVKSRQRLPSDRHLEHVYRPNAFDRSRDLEWLDYVNLSVSRINDWMFDASEKWHVGEDVSWVLLSFSIEILEAPGVVFTTTNNAYPPCRRAEGLPGFNQLFANTVPYGYYGSSHHRTATFPDPFPTDRQAEVLYPGELSMDYLTGISVQVESALDDVHGALGAFDMDFPVRLAPEVFE